MLDDDYERRTDLEDLERALSSLGSTLVDIESALERIETAHDASTKDLQEHLSLTIKMQNTLDSIKFALWLIAACIAGYLLRPTLEQAKDGLTNVLHFIYTWAHDWIAYLTT